MSPSNQTATDYRDFVEKQVRVGLPEFCRRNGITLPDRVLDNLAGWVTTAVPPGYVRADCTGGIPYERDDVIACACTGACMSWRKVRRRLRRNANECPVCHGEECFGKNDPPSLRCVV